MTRQHSSPLGTAGFTLVELLTVLVVLGVLTSIAGPRLGSVIRGNRVEGVMNQLNADVAYTRILAVRSGRSAALCFDTADRRIYTVVTGTCAAPVATHKRQDLRSHAVGVTVTVAQGASTLTQVGFNSRGMVAGAAAAVTLTAAQQGKTAAVELSPLGRTTRTY
jgi:type IV fimbrial biogenesis protein FimT